MARFFASFIGDEIPGYSAQPFPKIFVILETVEASVSNHKSLLRQVVHPGQGHPGIKAQGGIKGIESLLGKAKRAQGRAQPNARGERVGRAAGGVRCRGGRELDTAGDGFFASFDGPGRAVECARAVVASVDSLGLQVRAGHLAAQHGDLVARHEDLDFLSALAAHDQGHQVQHLAQDQIPERQDHDRQHAREHRFRSTTPRTLLASSGVPRPRSPTAAATSKKSLNGETSAVQTRTTFPAALIAAVRGLFVSVRVSGSMTVSRSSGKSKRITDG